MRPDNTSPNFSAKERIIYGIVTLLHFFNYIRIAWPCYFHGVHLYLQVINFRNSKIPHY